MMGFSNLIFPSCLLLLCASSDISATRAEESCGAKDNLGGCRPGEEEDVEAMQMELLQHRSLVGRGPVRPSSDSGDADAVPLTKEFLRGMLLESNRSLDGSLADKDYSQYRGQTVSGTFDCTRQGGLSVTHAMANKGIALDDDSFEKCSNKLPLHWPTTKAPIKTMRLFKPWGVTAPRIFHTNATQALQDLKDYAEVNGVQYLVGVSVTCKEDQDEAEWEMAMKLLRMLNPENVMGLAVGNEVDWNAAAMTCRHHLFQGGDYAARVQKRVKDFDSITGLAGKPITAVLSDRYGIDVGGTNAAFIDSLWNVYNTRFIASFNVYPQFSAGLSQAGCTGAVDVGTKFELGDGTPNDPDGFVPAVIKMYKKKIADNGWEGMKLWITETGWATEGYCALVCAKACYSKESQERFYKGFLKWDLQAAGEYAADHVFFFTIRDSQNFGLHERFGLITNCEETACKF
jgi:hypothetical protein